MGRNTVTVRSPDGTVVTRPLTPLELQARDRISRQQKVGTFRRRKPRTTTYDSWRTVRSVAS